MSDIKWYNTNMTSNTTPAQFVASASSVYDVHGEPFVAFDGKTETSVSNRWATATGQHLNSWIQLDFGERKKVNYIGIHSRNTLASGSTAQSPSSFKILASNNEADWEEIGRYSIFSWASNTRLNFPLKNSNYRYYRLFIMTNLGEAVTGLSEIQFGYDEKIGFLSYLILTNLDKYYSLSGDTLIHLSNNSNKNMILHGIEQGKEIQLDAPFTKHNYVNESPVDNVGGKVFTQDVSKINTLNIKEVKESDFEPIYTWYETNMTANNAPSPLVASANSEFNTDQQAWKAFNGDALGLPWATVNNAQNNSWIQIDFGSIRKVNMIQLTPRNAPNIAQTPKNFYVQTSKDSQNWTTVGEFDISDWIAYTPKILQLSFSEARYCKITHRTVNGGLNASWSEISYGLREVN